MKISKNKLGKLLGVSAFFIVTSASAAELIQNGNFENGSTAWSTYEQAGTITIGYHGGDIDATYDPTGSGQAWELQLYQVIDVVAGQTYTYSFEARATGGSSRPINFVVEKNGGDYAKHHEQTYQLTDTPNTFRGSFTATASEQVKVAFMDATNGVKAYIDEVSVTDSGSSSDQSGLNLDPVQHDTTLPPCNEESKGTIALVTDHHGGYQLDDVMVVCLGGRGMSTNPQYNWMKIVTGGYNVENNEVYGE